MPSCGLLGAGLQTRFQVLAPLGNRFCCFFFSPRSLLSSTLKWCDKSRHDLVSAESSSACINHYAAFKCHSMYVSNNLWCHLQQCPWEIGSVSLESVGQGEVGLAGSDLSWNCLLLIKLHTTTLQPATAETLSFAVDGITT